jgi:hypothetical protein
MLWAIAGITQIVMVLIVIGGIALAGNGLDVTSPSLLGGMLKDVEVMLGAGITIAGLFGILIAGGVQMLITIAENTALKRGDGVSADDIAAGQH